jgi:hypothetical protein
MIDLSGRAPGPELMDSETVTQADFAACLDDLATVNVLTRARAPTLGFLQAATRGWAPGRELRVMDCGFGRGDMLRAVHAWATARGLVPVLTGLDLNPHSAALARSRTPAAMTIEWRTGDIFDEPVGAHDFIISALFAHHLDGDGVTHFVRWMEASAARGWFVNDLHRHVLAYHGFRALSTVARWHRFVRHDGPLSVARAFTRADWQRILAEAGVPEADVRWHLPFRLCVGRLR